jgi:arylsulfatase A-like enzyme
MGTGAWRNGKLDGGKYGIMEGSTRVPFIVSWPGHTPQGSTSAALVSQIDLARTLCELVGIAVPATALPDSRNALPALLGSDSTGAPYIIEQNIGKLLAVRKGQYKYYRRNGKQHLFDLSHDLQEKHNIATEHPQLVQELDALLRAATKQP